jgi:S1-C subfamily serine protease
MAMPKQDSAGLDVKTIRALSGANPLVMQLDATAYPGNSGSPLYDPMTGEVVGVVNSVIVKSLRESPVSHPSGITFALPVGTLRALFTDRK